MRLLPCFLLFAASLHTSAQGGDREILAVVDRFFAALNARDTSALSPLMLREGLLHAVDGDKPERPAEQISHARYLSDVARTKQRILERYWDAQVWRNDRLATVTTRYDFHVDGHMSHCGTNVFTLVREHDGWKISGGQFTTHAPENCEDSPLGPAYK